MSTDFQVQQVLELACAAQRVNGAYLKEAEWVFDSEEKPVFQKQSNKILMLVTLEPAIWTADPAHQHLAHFVSQPAHHHFFPPFRPDPAV